MLQAPFCDKIINLRPPPTHTHMLTALKAQVRDFPPRVPLRETAPVHLINSQEMKTLFHAETRTVIMFGMSPYLVLQTYL